MFRNPLRNFVSLEIIKKIKKKEGFERRDNPLRLTLSLWGISKGLRLSLTFLINRNILVFFDLKV